MASEDTSLPENLLTLGPYRVIREIGAGGMGIVYLAIQKQPVEREVALKIIQAPSLVKTIALECKSLAAMNHPNVAVIFDGGADPISMMPYFAMEYVDGCPITSYCNEKRLSIKQRLDIFIQLCNGVQHAHQKRIIHRDLKPANVLVVEQDGKAIPKVIDFGLSTDLSEHKANGAISGTWEYMSPEQASGQQLDTQTDIYSLAVILHELLTGKRPLCSSLFVRSRDEVALQKNADLINNHEVPKASEVFADDESERAFTLICPDNPRSHRIALRNDFDFVVAKGLNKNPELRYDSAKELAEDVSRVIRHEVPLARPVSHLYAAKKFVRRNFAIVAATLLLILVSLGGAITSTLGWRTAIRNENEAKSAKEIAEQEAANSNFQLGNFLASENRLLEARQAFSQIPKERRKIEWWLTQKSIDSSDFSNFAHSTLVTDVCFSPNRRWVVSAGRDAKAVIWDVQTGNVVHFLQSQGPITSVNFSPDSSKIVTASEGGELSIWDSKSGKQIASSNVVVRKEVSCVRFDWDSSKVIVGANSEILVWDYLKDETRILFKHPAAVTAICLSADGNTVASASRSQDIQVWDYETGNLVASPKVNFPIVFGVSEVDFNHVVSLDFSPDGGELAFSIASTFGERPVNLDNVGVWDFEQQKVRQIKGHAGGGVRYPILTRWQVCCQCRL